jgi:hypothetical protein
MKVLIKAMRPHRQKVLTEDGEEMRLQQWANKAASSALRGAGGDASGEQFTQVRDALMREAVANPDEHGLKFMGERLPFDGQELKESLSEPDVEGERAMIDNQFNQDPMNDPDFKEDMTEDESFELAEKLDRKTPDIFDEQGKLRQTLPQEEEEFDPDAEAEHLRRIMNSRDVPMRDAWSILKFGYPSVAGAESPKEVRARHNVSPFSRKCAKCSKDFSLFRGQIADDICADCQKQMGIPWDTREQQE